MLNLKKSIYLVLIFTFSFSVELLYGTRSEISGFQLVRADLLEAYGGVAGEHSVYWNASSHSSGVYLVRMTSGSYKKTQKIMLLK